MIDLFICCSSLILLSSRFLLYESYPSDPYMMPRDGAVEIGQPLGIYGHK